MAEVVKEFTFFRPRYRIDGLGWVISGDFLAHNYSITAVDTPIATVNKAWMSWGDCYALDIADSRNQVLALAVVLAIDCVLGQNAGVSVCPSVA